MEFLRFLCKKNPKICKMFWKNHQTFQTTKLLKKILIIFKNKPLVSMWVRRKWRVPIKCLKCWEKDYIKFEVPLNTKRKYSWLRFYTLRPKVNKTYLVPILCPDSNPLVLWNHQLHGHSTFHFNKVGLFRCSFDFKRCWMEESSLFVQSFILLERTYHKHMSCDSAMPLHLSSHNLTSFIGIKRH
jgi:hypothetical protein